MICLIDRGGSERLNVCKSSPILLDAPIFIIHAQFAFWHSSSSSHIGH